MDPDERETERSPRHEADGAGSEAGRSEDCWALGLVAARRRGRHRVERAPRGRVRERVAAARTRAAAPPREAPMPAMPGMPAGQRPAAGAAAKDDDPVEVSLTPEAVERAGIKTAVGAQRGVGGRDDRPGHGHVQCLPRHEGQRARRRHRAPRRRSSWGRRWDAGRPLAVIFSSELADAQMKYLSMQAMLVADHQKLDRTEKLAAIGAASRQELEEVTAVHHAHETEVAAARQRLLLLGLTSEQVGALQDASQVVSEVTVTAPSEGLVIGAEREPGPGGRRRPGPVRRHRSQHGLGHRGSLREGLRERPRRARRRP